jgi:predicted Zn-dependent protease
MKTKIILLAALAASCVIDLRAEAKSPVTQAASALKAGDIAAAESLVAPLAAVTPPDAAALNLLSQIRLAQRRVKDAVDAAEAATQADPTKPEHFSQLGAALSMRMGEVGFMQLAMLSGKMKSAFEKSVELDPKHVPGLIGLARFYSSAPEIAGGNLRKAADFAERVKVLLPHAGEFELGRIAEKREEFATALAHYEASLAIRADSPNVQVSAGRMLVRLGRKDEARARFEVALQQNPNHSVAKKALAELDAPRKEN